MAIPNAANLVQQLAAQAAAKQQVLQNFLAQERDTSAADAWLAEQQAGLEAYYEGMKAGEGAENTVTLSNKETSWLSNVWNAGTTFVQNKIVQPAVTIIQDKIIQPINKYAYEPILKPVVQAVTPVVKAATQAVTNTWNAGASTLAGVLSPAKSTSGGGKLAAPAKDDPPPTNPFWNWVTSTWKTITTTVSSWFTDGSKTIPTPNPTSVVQTLVAQIIDAITANAPTRTPTSTPTIAPMATLNPTLVPTAQPTFQPIPGGTGTYSSYWYGKSLYDMLANSSQSEWWSNYQNQPFGMKSYVGIVYNYEIASLNTDPSVRDYLTEAFARRFWQSQHDYGAAGAFYYLGGRDMVRLRVIDQKPSINAEDYDMQNSFQQAELILNNPEWQEGIIWNGPYDWGNPTEKTSSLLPLFMKTLNSGNVGVGDNQLLYISRDKKFFIVTQGQINILCGNQSCVNPTFEYP